MCVCVNTGDVIQLTFNQCEAKVIYNGLNGVKKNVRTKSIYNRINNLIKKFSDAFIDIESNEIKIDVSTDEISDLISLIMCFLPTETVDVFSELLSKKSGG